MKYKTSLATLLFFATLLAASGLTSIAYAHDDGGKSGSGMHCEHQHLSQAKIDLLRTAMKKVHEENKDVFEELHKLHKEQHDILAAKTFDKAAYLSVSAKIEAKRDQLVKAHTEAFASIADKFTPEEREHLVRKFGHRHGHHHGGWHHAEWKHGEERQHWNHSDGQKDGVSTPDQAQPVSTQEEAVPETAK